MTFSTSQKKWKRNPPSYIYIEKASQSGSFFYDVEYPF